MKYKFNYGHSLDWMPYFFKSDDKLKVEKRMSEMRDLGWECFSAIYTPNDIEFDGKKITRVEFIGENGRELVIYLDKFDFLIQDDGRTLKIVKG